MLGRRVWESFCKERAMSDAQSIEWREGCVVNGGGCNDATSFLLKHKPREFFRVSKDIALDTGRIPGPAHGVPQAFLSTPHT